MERWTEAVQRIQGAAERAGYACMDLLIRLIRWAIATIKTLRDRWNDHREGEGYLKEFPK